jgi:hypothetical protein
MALTDQGVLSYDAFRVALIGRIAAWEAASPEGEPYSYYHCWLQALEQVLDGAALVASGEVDTRSAALAARPAGHDHRHDDDHDHPHGHHDH